MLDGSSNSWRSGSTCRKMVTPTRGAVGFPHSSGLGEQQPRVEIDLTPAPAQKGSKALVIAQAPRLNNNSQIVFHDPSEVAAAISTIARRGDTSFLLSPPVYSCTITSKDLISFSPSSSQNGSRRQGTSLRRPHSSTNTPFDPPAHHVFWPNFFRPREIPPPCSAASVCLGSLL